MSVQLDQSVAISGPMKMPLSQFFHNIRILQLRLKVTTLIRLIDVLYENKIFTIFNRIVDVNRFKPVL